MPYQSADFGHQLDDSDKKAVDADDGGKGDLRITPALNVDALAIALQQLVHNKHHMLSRIGAEGLV